MPITRLGFAGYGTRRTGNFAGKTPAVSLTLKSGVSRLDSIDAQRAVDRKGWKRKVVYAIDALLEDTKKQEAGAPSEIGAAKKAKIEAPLKEPVQTIGIVDRKAVFNEINARAEARRKRAEQKRTEKERAEQARKEALRIAEQERLIAAFAAGTEKALSKAVEAVVARALAAEMAKAGHIEEKALALVAGLTFDATETIALPDIALPDMAFPHDGLDEETASRIIDAAMVKANASLKKAVSEARSKLERRVKSLDAASLALLAMVSGLERRMKVMEEKHKKMMMKMTLLMSNE